MSVSVAKSRNNKKPLPEKLKRIIERLSLLPTSAPLPPLKIKSWELRQDILRQDRKKHLEALYELRKRLEIWSMFFAGFTNYIYGRKVNFDNKDFFLLGFVADLNFEETIAALKRYEDFVLHRRTLKTLIKSVENFPAKEMRYLPLIIPAQVQMLVKDGKVESFEFDELPEALQGVEISRIKICPIENCLKFFWLYKSNQTGCNPKHSNKVRNRRYRSKEKQKQMADEEKENLKKQQRQEWLNQDFGKK